FEDSQTLFLGTLHALTRAIDAKDSYTFGHSERVAALSRLLAQAADLDESTAERVYLSALVHDVGKIGVPESVLCKPGRLTDEEFELIKAHPEIGAKIIRDIRQMEDLIPGVMHHHERWDGRGYPHRLGGLDIPLFGRIIGLADAFDAMSSNRTYRSALDHERVLKEIRLNRGTQFDPELAERFFEIDFTPFFTLIHRHRAQANRGPA
ncbi:MAG: HD-GYP domain-containing protein, partial [Planctomycetota bacterium]